MKLNLFEKVMLTLTFIVGGYLILCTILGHIDYILNS